MLKFISGYVRGGMLLLLATLPVAAALPQVKLEPVFPALTLNRPVWMSEAPDGSGRCFIVEQDGRIVIVPKGSDGAAPMEFFNITDRKPHQGNEEGLLSLAFHPQFKTNGLFYVYYTQHDPRRSIVSEFKVSATDSNRADLASERVLLEIPEPYENHNGGEVAFGPDGYFYISLGDGGAGGDPHNNAQNCASLLGKFLRIDVNSRSYVGRDHHELAYGIPSDNPLVNEPTQYGVRHEIWAYGMRNAWRYSWDRQTGMLWAGDVGQDLWEEVDIIVKGGNYGWNVREGLHHFKPGPEGAQYIDPVIEYPHNPNLLPGSKYPNHGIGLSITGGYVYRGQKYPALDGVYVYADFALGTISGLRYADGHMTEYGTLLEQPKNIASFAEDNAGELYVLAFDGKVYAVTVPGQ